MKKDDYETIRKELQFYLEKQIKIHIKLGFNHWLNGLILKINKDNLVLNENKFGEMIVFFERISSINPMKVRE